MHLHFTSSGIFSHVLIYNNANITHRHYTGMDLCLQQVVSRLMFSLYTNISMITNAAIGNTTITKVIADKKSGSKLSTSGIIEIKMINCKTIPSKMFILAVSRL